MKSLFKIMGIIAFCFALTFIVVKLSGILTIDDIKAWLKTASELSPIYVGSIVALLLFIDIFIAVPTLAVTLLAGYFLGFIYGAIAALLGIVLAGIAGYMLSYIMGEKLLRFLVKNQQDRNDAVNVFRQHGFIMITLSRALPILPEVTSCLSGITKMRFMTFISAWMISCVPYVLIASYAGSISSLDDPKPAIVAAIGIWGTLWCCWYVFQRVKSPKNTLAN